MIHLLYLILFSIIGIYNVLNYNKIIRIKNSKKGNEYRIIQENSRIPFITIII